MKCGDAIHQLKQNSEIEITKREMERWSGELERERDEREREIARK